MAAQSFANVRPIGGFPFKGTLPSPRLFATGNVQASAAADGTEITPATTELYLSELLVTAPCWTTGIAPFNGTVGTGNAKYGLYNSAGLLVCTTTAAAQTAGNDAYERIAWTKEFVSVPGTATTIISLTFLAPGTYFVGYNHSTTAGRVNGHTLGNHAQGKVSCTQATCMISTELSVVLPTTFTAAGSTAGGIIASLY